MKRLINLLTGHFQYYEIDPHHPLRSGAKLEGLPPEASCRVVQVKKN